MQKLPEEEWQAVRWVRLAKNVLPQSRCTLLPTEHTSFNSAYSFDARVA